MSSPQPPLRSFDRVAHCYDETRGLPPDAERAIAAGIARIVREAASAPHVLEVGVGTGRIAVPLAAAGVRVTGLDIAPKMLAGLRRKRRDIDVMLAEAAHPPLRADAFDALLFVHILHLVPDAMATLRATLPLVRPGGVVVHGGDEGHVALRAQAEDLIRSAVADLANIDITAWDVHERTRLMTEAYLRSVCGDVRTETIARWRTHSRGRAMLERLARKDFSSSWMIPDEVLPAVIERVTPELEKLYGGLDREVEAERAFNVTVGRLKA